MNHLKKIIILLFLFSSSTQVLFAELPYYLDFKFILNNSDAGKKAQLQLKSKLDSGLKSLSAREKTIQGDEKKLLNKRK